MRQAANIKSVFHNAETGMFEALVVLLRDGTQHAYDVAVPGAITSDFETLRPALIAAAEAQHTRCGSTLIRRTRATPMRNRTEKMLQRIRLAQLSTRDQVLKRAA